MAVEDPKERQGIANTTRQPKDLLPGESWPDGNGGLTSVQKRRLYAAAIDIIALFFVSIVALDFYHDAVSDDPNPNPFLGWWHLLPAILASVPYHIVAELIWGRSPGKAMFGLKVVAYRGSHIWWRVILRSLSKLLWFIPPLLLLDFILVVATPRARRWVDWIVGTTVISTRASLQSAAEPSPASADSGDSP